MDVKNFFIGLGFSSLAFLFYRWVKNEKLDFEGKNDSGLLPQNVIGLWGTVIFSIIVAITFFLKAC